MKDMLSNDCHPMRRGCATEPLYDWLIDVSSQWLRLRTGESHPSRYQSSQKHCELASLDVSETMEQVKSSM